MFEYIYYIFSIIIFFILVRETIIDIKTMYVPDNITFAIYTASSIYLIISWFITGSFHTIKNGLFGFLLGFGVPFTISFISYLIQLLIHKWQKNKNQHLNITTSSTPINNEVKSKTDNTEISTTNTSKKIIVKRILYWLLCLVFLIITSITQTIIPWLIYLGVSIPFLIAVIISYEKTKRIDFAIYLTAVGMLVIALWPQKNSILIPLTIGAIIIELILAKIFQKFYKIETDISEEDDSDGLEGGIGGGDILIFGALGLMFGLKGIVIIFLYALLSQLLVILSYSLLSSEKSFSGHIPFVPGIAIGTYLYIMRFDLLNFQQIIFFFWGV